MGRRATDLTGKRFGRLVVIKRYYHSSRIHNHASWICKCDCGNEVVVYSNHLLDNSTKSCGCYQRDRMTTHCLTNSRIYRIWCVMKARCSNSSFKYYNCRGITVCNEWSSSFQAFYDWAMANGYRDNLSIDRIDNDKGYCPENCRWATPKEQSNNTRRNIKVKYKGESHTLAEWSEHLDIPYMTLYGRIAKLHWTADKALSTPSHRCNKNINGGNNYGIKS